MSFELITRRTWLNVRDSTGKGAFKRPELMSTLIDSSSMVKPMNVGLQLLDVGIVEDSDPL